MRRLALLDSGLGGLTVLAALRAIYPDLDVFYFADTAHVPYGDLPLATVAEYGYAMTRRLLEFDPHAIVVASGTTCAAFEANGLPQSPVPVVGVVGPGSRAASAASRTGAIGVVATRATVDSKIFERMLLRERPDARVTSIAAPKLVPIVESGEWASERARAAVEEISEPLRAARCDTVVLGCTHFPHLQSWFVSSLGDGVTILDPAEACAAETCRLVAARLPGGGSLAFLVSGDPIEFSAYARKLGGVRANSVRQVRI